MLTHAQVIELATSCGLQEHAEQIAGSVQPGWRLVAGTADPGAHGRSKVGGDPDLASGERWPLNARGVPLTFLAQVNTAMLPAIDAEWADRIGWAHDGRLVRFFADLLDNPFEPGDAAALACDPEDRLERTAHPVVPADLLAEGQWADLEMEDRFWDLPECPLVAEAFLTAPEVQSGVGRGPVGVEEVADRYQRFAYRLRVDGEPGEEEHPGAWDVQHLLGEPYSDQDDPREMAAYLHMTEAARVPDRALERAGAWQVLLALHDDPSLGLEILDAGALHVLAPVKDLAAGRYDRLVCDVASC